MSDVSRVCYLVPGALSAGPLGPAEVVRRQAILGGLAAPTVSVEVREAVGGPASVESVAEERQAAGVVCREVRPLAGEGFAAVIVGCFGDPGVVDARRAVPVPVIGPAAASIEAAAERAARFGIVTVVEGVIPTLRDLVASYGHAPALASLRAVEIPVLRLRERRDETFERLVAEGRASMADGAAALVLGCMTMGFLGLADDLEAELQIPVVNPVQAALRAAEAAIAPPVGARAGR